MYMENREPTTLDRKAEQARARRTRRSQRRQALTILNGMNALRVQEAITRAYRSKRTATKEGGVRRYRIGAHVAAMCRQLLHWDGRGEAQGDWVHKTGFEWEHSEAGLTRSKLRTARRIAREEGLIEENPGTRRDQRATVFYRLDVWKLAEVVVQSELENARKLLASEGREEHKARLRKQIRGLEVTKADLAIRDAPDVAPVSASGEGHTYGENGGLDCETRFQELETPANLTSYPGENSRVPPSTSRPYSRGTSVENPSRFRSSTDSSRGDEAVASDDTPVASAQKVNSERLQGMMDICGFGDPASTIGDELGRLMRGEGGRSGEEVLGPMVASHLSGEDVAVEDIARTARGFFGSLKNRPLPYFVGAVETVLEKMRVE